MTPGRPHRTQLYSSGAEAVESALRLAKSYTGKTEVIGFWGGFHGKTAGVLPLLGSNFKHAPRAARCRASYSTPYASCARCAFDKTFPSCEWHCVEFLRRKIELETTNDVAAIIVEPIQGTAGNIVPPPGYLRVLRALADKIGAVLIADEMLTGFGRTGTMFAVEHDGVVPDIMTIGKGFGGGFPMTGVIARETVAHAKPWANPSGSSSSYGGNPLAAAAARVRHRDDLEEGLVEHSRVARCAHARRDEDVGRDDPHRARRPRARSHDRDGSGRSRDRPTDAQGSDAVDLRHAAESRGVLAMIYNPEVRINPPLVIREAEAMEALAT